jgi:polysaccharide export outer membrane protein
MRPCRLLAVLMIAAAVAGCAHTAGPPGPPEAAAGPGDLDSIAYGRLGPGPAAVPAPMPQPIPAAMPGPLPGPIPATMLPPPVVAPAPMPNVMPVLLPTNEPYTLDSGDRLRITVYGQDGLSNTYIVDASGRITMPFIGPVSARGCTTTQLARVIADRLRNGYIREPHVAIEVETYRPFFILGEVAFPGQYPYVANMTVETAIAIAGGFSPRAKRDAVDLSRPHDGQIVKGNVPMYTPVRPGDTITVAERWF